MKTLHLLKIAFFFLLFTAGCTDHDIPEPDILTSEEFVGDLVTPFGVTKGEGDNLWVTEVGTGENDGQVSLITPDGAVYPAIVGFTSEISEEEGLPDGLTHLKYKDGKLYIVQGRGGFLYIVDVSGFEPGDAPIQASTLSSENIGQFVLDHDFIIDTGESHLYNLTWGIDGDLFFTDAAANAIIRRKANGDLSVFSEFPQFPNSTGVGPPMVDFVPTGITYDGTKFLVSALSGFPFVEGNAAIYQLNAAGTPSLYKSGYTMLTDITLTPSNSPLVIQFAQFSPATGFAPNTGKVSDGNGIALLENIMMPTDIERTGDKTYFMVSSALGKVYKLTY
ncbi:ScyD/ScyE family protein [Dyadobacter sp. NIV53]|uniref:ScyD/ScyE family protein n=1 Tax=Dyadobacter sp. NIV53 TaxID=2861765 RepID=UPI001C86EA63|nr:ScyD/ScyE family protein [Dyadobacter sp. NIV53]